MRSLLRYHLFFLCFCCIAMQSFAHPTVAPQQPFYFLENKGQITDQDHRQRKDIDYKLQSDGVTVFIGSGALHYQWSRTEQKDSTPIDLKYHRPTAQDVDLGAATVHTYRMDVRLVGANLAAKAVTENPTGYYEQYYLPATPDGALAQSYGKITYKDIYPNIDWVLYLQEGRLKYDFIIHPGGDVQNIKLKYEGATRLYLEEGALIAETPMGRIIEAAPYTYHNTDREPVETRYVLQGQMLSYQLSTIDNITIDPTIEWGTYYGGNDVDGDLSEIHAGVTVDSNGNIYFCGRTESTGNIASSGAYENSYLGSVDIFIVKFNEQGSRQWATYYGGVKSDFIGDIVIDASGSSFYITGITQNAGLASSGAYQTTFPSGVTNISVAYLAKFSSSGSRQWATYYGDTVSQGRGLACDAGGNIWMIGLDDYPASSYSYTTSGAFKSSPTGGKNSFVVQFSSSGSRLYASFLYGEVESISFDAQGDYYIGGSINQSYTGAVTAGAWQGSIGGGLDGYLTKFHSNNSRAWATYYGGSGIDYITEVASDAAGNTYILGSTNSTNNMASAGAHKTSAINGNGYMFLACMKPDGARRWSTYYGIDTVYGAQAGGIDIGKDGNIYTIMTAIGNSSDSLSTPDAYKTHNSTDRDVVLTRWTDRGGVEYATYYGGNYYYQRDFSYYHNNLVCSPRGKIIFSGITTSNSGIAYGSSPHQSTYSGNTDCFLVQFGISDTMVFIEQYYTDTVLCPGDSFAINYGVTDTFASNNTFTVQLSDANGEFGSNPVTIATKSATTPDSIHCAIPYNTPPGDGYRIRILSSAPLDSSADNQWDIKVKAFPAAITATATTPICAGDTLYLTGSSSDTGVSWSWSGPVSFSSSAEDTIRTNITTSMAGSYILTATLNNSGCSISDTDTVVVKPLPAAVNATSNSPACTGKTLNLSAGTSTNGSSYAWIGPGGYTANTQNTNRTNITTGMAGDYVSVITLNGCVYRDTTTVVINPTPATPTASNNGPLCVGQTLSLTANTINNASYTWWGPASYTANTQNANRIGIQTNHAGTYMVTATVNGCESDTGKTTLVVNTAPYVTVYPSPGDTVCQGGTASFIAVPFNGGSSTVYNWRINGTPTGSGTTTFSTTALNNGDVVDVVMTATGSCASAFTDTSNGISMNVLPYLTPTASITVSPGTLVAPWSMVNFSSTVTNGGNNPQYQWTKNGQNIVGATSDNWGTFSLSDGDVICVEVTSDYKCPQPKTVTSNCMEMHLKLGTEDLNNIKRDWQLYPNPAHTVINLSINFKVDEMKILDAAGRDVFGYIAPDNRKIDVSNLSNGVYIIRVTHENGITYKRFTKF